MRLCTSILLFIVSVASNAVVVCAQTPLLVNSPLSSFTEPYRTIDVAAPETGKLAAIKVVEGAVVEQSMTLAQLDDRVLQASLEMVKQSCRAQGRLNSRLAELQLQTKQFEKLLELKQRQHASQAEIDRAKTQLAIAQGQVETVRDEQLLKTYESKHIEAQIEQRLIRSPIDGIVTQIFKDPGEFVSAGDPVVLRVVQLDPLLAIFSVPQSQASKFSVDEKLMLKIGDSHQRATGVIEFVSPTADAQSGTCRVKVKIANPDHRWPSGVRCVIDSGSLTASRDKPSRNSHLAKTP